MQERRVDQRLKTSEQRSEILQAYRRKKVTQREFAKQRQIGLSTLQSWLRKAPADSGSKSRRFIPLPNLLASLPPTPTYQVRFANGLALEISSGFKDEELARLLPILQRS